MPGFCGFLPSPWALSFLCEIFDNLTRKTIEIAHEVCIEKNNRVQDEFQQKFLINFARNDLVVILPYRMIISSKYLLHCIQALC